MCGQSAVVRSMNAMATEIAPNGHPVSFVREGGTSTEVYARLIHRSPGLRELQISYKARWYKIKQMGLEVSPSDEL